jgi:alcohol dehydrogenase class IV
MVFTISAKSEVLFGEGASGQTGEKVRSFGCKKVLCLYDEGIKKAGIVDPIVAQIRDADIEVVSYGGVMPDPPDTMVNECGELARQEKVDGVVGIGGGSTLDTAKGVNLLLSNPGSIQDYFGQGIPVNPSKPLILIPTTAGTASEITYVAVISNTKAHVKNGVKGPATIANLAIVDPTLTKGLPPHITASTGMDTFAHAVEAYTSKGNNIMSDTLSEKSIKLVAEYLPKAVKNGSDMEARTQMSFACLIAGMAFNDAVPHFGHAFGHTLGAFHHVPHGIGCAIAQPAVVEMVADIMPQKVRRIGEIMGLKLGKDLPSADMGKQVAEGIIAFTKEIGIPTLKELNITESDLEPLAKGTMADVCFFFVPKDLEMQDVLNAIKKSYAIQPV